MKLHVLDIPDDAAQLAPWLERQLVGLELGELVAELEAVHGTLAPKQKSLDEITGAQLSAALQNGLSACSPNVLRQLLTNPRALLELQERIFIDGGSYWSRVPATADVLDIVHGSWRRLEPTLEVAPTTAAHAPIPYRARSWFAHPAFVSLATAAMLLVGVFVVDQFRTAAPSGWGWERPGALAANVPPDEYLNRLANSADEWFKKRPESAPELAKRILEFRRGCTTLIFAEHQPLAAADREWLVERCRVWAGKLDDHLAQLEGGGSVQDVRTQADDTVNKLIAALRERSKSVG